MDIRKVILIITINVAIGACGAGNNGGSSQNTGATPPPPPPPLTTCESKIPPEQLLSVRHEFNPYPIPPSGYGAVIGWVNATIGNGGISGKVTVNNLRLWEKYNDLTTLIAESITCPTCTNPNDNVWGFTVEKNLWNDNSAWFKPNEGTKYQVQANTVIAPVGNLPNHVYHFWHTYDPRPPTRAGAKYYLTSDVIVEGDAMVQIGIDYYQFTVGGNLLQAAVSNWHCASSSVQTVRAGAYQ